MRAETRETVAGFRRDERGRRELESTGEDVGGCGGEETLAKVNGRGARVGSRGGWEGGGGGGGGGFGFGIKAADARGDAVDDVRVVVVVVVVLMTMRRRN